MSIFDQVTPFAKESLTVSSTAVGFASDTATVVNPARVALVTVETDQARYWVDGSTPTASAGHLLEAGDALVLREDEINRFKAIRVTTDATLRATFYS